MFTQTTLFEDGYGLSCFHDALYDGDLTDHCEAEMQLLFEGFPEPVKALAFQWGFRACEFRSAVRRLMLERTVATCETEASK